MMSRRILTPRTPRLALGALTVGLALPVTLTACGQEEKPATQTQTQTTAPATTQPSGGATGAGDQTISVRATEYALEVEQAPVKSGTIELNLTNEGKVVHALEIEGNGVEQRTPDIQPGESATLKVDLKAGIYELYCPVGGHKEQGMATGFNVTG